MELSLDVLHAKAVRLSKAVEGVTLKAERVRGAKRSKRATLQTIALALKDFSSLRESKAFSDKEVAAMLGNTCLETASFLFSAGALPWVWREWCGLAGLAFYLEKDLAYSMELLTIARTEIDPEVSEALKNAELGGYREQAIQFVIFRPRNHQPPSLPPIHALDNYYASLVRFLELGDRHGLVNSVKKIVEFWLSETSSERFEPGIFPVFEPEINAIVAALSKQGFDLELGSPRITSFLRAGLE